MIRSSNVQLPGKAAYPPRLKMGDTNNNPKFPSAFLVAIAVLLVGVACSRGHQDTPITLKDGVLQGLPDEFQSAGFDRETGVLTIKGKKVEFPQVLETIFNGRWDPSSGKAEFDGSDAYNLEFHSSWYHGPSFFPPYLGITVIPKNRDYRFRILVNLEAGSVIEAAVLLEAPSNGLVEIPISLNKTTNGDSIPDDWREIIGEWTDGLMFLKVTDEEITVTSEVPHIDKTGGKITLVKPGLLSLTNRAGEKEVVSFSTKGDILGIRIGDHWGTQLVRVGSEAEKTWQGRNSNPPPQSSQR